MKRTSTLEKKYSWEELGVLFADRIEKTDFITPKDWIRKTFLLWFAKREKIGILFDWRLVARCFMISRSLEKKHDHFTVIVGGEGLGKSTLALQYSAWIAPDFELEELVFDMGFYVKKLQEIAKSYKQDQAEKKQRAIILDEGGISLFSREALSKSNKVLAKTFMVQRFLNVAVTICIPHYWSLDSLIRNHRVNTLIVIKKRGYYKTTVGKGIKILNRLGMKDKEKPLFALPIPYGFFWEGNFNAQFPKTIKIKDYEQRKFKHIGNFLEESKLEAESVQMYNVKRIEKEFGINKEDIILEINNGNIKGKKIGREWFITKKAYKKLMVA